MEKECSYAASAIRVLRTGGAFLPQQRLNLSREPQGQGALRGVCGGSAGFFTVEALFEPRTTAARVAACALGTAAAAFCTDEANSLLFEPRTMAARMAACALGSATAAFCTDEAK